MVNTIHNNGHNAGLLKAIFRDISQDTTEGNRRQQQRLKALANSHVQQYKANDNHNNVAACQSRKARVRPYRRQSNNKRLKHKKISSLSFLVIFRGIYKLNHTH